MLKILITGSAGHLGEALVRTVTAIGEQAVGIDIKDSDYTHHIGSITNRAFVHNCMQGIDAVLHTATLHKPHVATHTRQDFIDVNLTGTLNLLEEAATAGVKAFIYTSTTSTFGDAMRPTPGSPAVWVTEDLRPKPKNIYGVTKTAAEDLCQLFSRNQHLPCIVLRTSRFFPEQDDDKSKRDAFGDDNLKVNELLFRRVDIEDIVSAHLLAIEKANVIGFDRFIISATTPFNRSDATELGTVMPSVVARYVADYKPVYKQLGWQMLPGIGRVYDNTHARNKLGWLPHYNFDQAIQYLSQGKHYQSQLARDVGSKAYHDTVFTDGPYPVET